MADGLRFIEPILAPSSELFSPLPQDVLPTQSPVADSPVAPLFEAREELGDSGLVSAGLAFGANNALASTLDFASLSVENPEIRSNLEGLRDIFAKRSEKHLANRSVQQAFSTPFSKNIVDQTKFNVASALPLFGTALGTTFLTAGMGAPASVAAVTGASTFFPTSYSSFYREATANGMPDKEASKFATIAGLGEVGLETFAFGGFLKGGSLLRQVLRGVAREGIIEEGSQQILSNSLKILGWKGYDNIANDLFEDVAASVVAGGVLGAGGGGAAFAGQAAGIIPYSHEDLDADIERARTRSKTKMRREAFKQGKTEEDIAQAEAVADTAVDSLKAQMANKLDRGEFQEFIDNIYLQDSDIALRAGLIEVTARGQTFDTINAINEFDDDTRFLADEIATRLIEDKRAELEQRGINVDNDLPSQIKDMLTVSIMSDISEGIVDDTLEIENALYLNDLLAEDKVYVLGAGKKHDDPGAELKLFNGVHGNVTMKELANNVKNVEQDGLRSFSITPQDMMFLFEVAQRPNADKLGESGFTSKVAKAFAKEYLKSKKIEVRPDIDADARAKLGEVAKDFMIDETMTEDEIQDTLIDFFNRDVVDLGLARPPRKTPLEKAVDEAVEELRPEKPPKTPEEKTSDIVNEPHNPKIILTANEFKEQIRVLEEFVARNPDRVDAVKKLAEMKEQYNKDYPPTPGDQQAAEVYEWENRHDEHSLDVSFSQDEQDVDGIFDSKAPTTPNDPDTNPFALSYIYTDTQKQAVQQYRDMVFEFMQVVKNLIPTVKFGTDKPLNLISARRLEEMVAQGIVDPEVAARVVIAGNMANERVFNADDPNELAEDIKSRLKKQSRSNVQEIKKTLIAQLNSLALGSLSENGLKAVRGLVKKISKARRIDADKILKGFRTRLKNEGILEDVQIAVEGAQKRVESIGIEYDFKDIEAEYRRKMDEALAVLPKKLRDQIKAMSMDEIQEWLDTEQVESDKSDLHEINQEVAEGGRPVSVQFSHPIRITTSDGKQEILKGKYRVLAEGDNVILKKGKKKVSVTQQDMANMYVQGVKESIDGISSYIDTTYHANRCGSACAGGPGEPRTTFNSTTKNTDDSNQWNYQQNKVQEGTYVDHEVDPENPRKMSMKSWLSFAGVTHNISVMKEAMRKNLFPDDNPEKPNWTLNDQVLTYLYGDKRFRKYAEEVATINMRPTFEIAWGIATEMSKRLNNGKVDKEQTQRIWDALSKVMFHAGEEVYSRQGHPRLFSKTKLGRRHAHENSVDADNPDGERVAYTELMILVHKTFNIPFNDADVNRWQVERDELSFFNVLGKLPGGEQLQASLIYNKAELETPLLERALSEGLFSGTNMWKNIDRGFQHRAFDKKGIQKDLSAPPRGSAGIKSPNIQPAKYRTNAEFVRASNEQGLQPIDNYFTSMIEYLSDYETHIAQIRSLQAMKGLIANNQAVLPGFEEDGAVNDLIKQAKIVEYASSPIIKALAEKTGLQPQNILQMLDYAEDHESPGFAEWSGGAFKKPFLYAPFLEAKREIFRKPDSKDAVAKTNQILTFLKRVITINPLDAAALFMTPVFLNYSFRELAGLPVHFAKSLAQTPDIARRLWEGEALPSLDEDVQTYENWDLFVKHGAMFYNYQAAEESLWDRQQIGAYRELQTHGENFADFMTSVGGLNAAIFQNFVAQNLYNVTDKMYNRFLDQGIEADRAARLAVKFVNDTSFMLNPDIFGPHGRLLVTTFFTRNLTVGFMRLMAGAAFPFLPKGWTQLKTGEFSSLTNSITHGDTSMKDMSFLARYYQIHVLKVMAAGILLNSLIQFAMSFFDDDEVDEHGEVGDGRFDVKKRYVFMNERGKRSMIRTPFKNMRGQRVYFSPQIFREAQHVQQILGDWGSESPPENMAKWFVNRLSLATIPMFLLFNRDYFGKEIRDTDLSLELQTKQVKDFIIDQGIPLGFRREERVTTGDPVIDVPLLVAELFGLNKRTGVPTDPFTTVEQINKLRDDEAVLQFLRSVDLSLADKSTIRRLAIEHPALFRGKATSELIKRELPGASQVKKLRSSSGKVQPYLGKELEVWRELNRKVRGR